MRESVLGAAAAVAAAGAGLRFADGAISYAAAVVATCIGLLFALYPNRRVCTCFEFLTDGKAPDYMANAAQLGLLRIWERAFAKRVFDPRGEIAAAVAELAADGNSVLEICSGGGGISALLLAEGRRRDPELTTTVVLTDIQPHVEVWKRAQEVHPPGALEFIPTPVDAMDVAGSLRRAGQGVPPAARKAANAARVRMINFALHHFEPPLVRKIFADVVSTGGSIVVGDLKPCAGGVLNNHLICHVETPQVIAEIWPPPLHLLPLAPLAPFFATWDSTVSVLRAYSAQQLAEIAASIPGGGPESYETRVIETGSFADFLGVPEFARRLMPGIRSPVGQFFFLYPKSKGKPGVRMP